MRKVAAIKQCEDDGYTIRFAEYGDEIRFRKPGAAMDGMNQPYEYMLVRKIGREWTNSIIHPPKIL